MIKINLLNSVTDRVGNAEMGNVASAVEKRIANPQSQMIILASAVFGLMMLGMMFDYWITSANQAQANADLEEQQRVAVQMQAVMKEQAELEKQTAAVAARVEAIKQLRANQQGPVAVLSAINERIPSLNDFKLEAIEQTAGELVVRGDSPNEMAVTQFGRSLEFSSGLFTNVSIEIQRKALDNVTITAAPDSTGNPASLPKPETVGFTVKARYTPPVAAPSAAVPTASVASNVAPNIVQQ